MFFISRALLRGGYINIHLHNRLPVTGIGFRKKIPWSIMSLRSQRSTLSYSTVKLMHDVGNSARSLTEEGKLRHGLRRSCYQAELELRAVPVTTRPSASAPLASPGREGLGADHPPALPSLPCGPRGCGLCGSRDCQHHPRPTLG